MAAVATEACPECGGHVAPDGVEQVCDDCGLVVDVDDIDHGPEWRAHDAAERCRVGPPRNGARHDRGLGSRIGSEGPERSGSLSWRARRQDRRANTSSKRERNRVYGFVEIGRICDVLGRTHTARVTACRLFEQAQKANVAKGRSLDALAAAAVLAAARVHQEPVTTAGVVDASRDDDALVWRTYRVLRRTLDVPIPPVAPADLVAGICSDVGVNGAIRTEAERLVREHRLDVQGRHPAGVAAAAVYLATGGTVQQENLADAAAVTATTIRNAGRDIDAERWGR